MVLILPLKETTVITEYFTEVKDNAKPFTCIILVNPRNNLLRSLLLFSMLGGGG